MTMVTIFRCTAGAVDCVKKRNGLQGFMVCSDDDKFKGADGKPCPFLKPLKVEE
jgi:hypothetical protein